MGMGMAPPGMMMAPPGMMMPGMGPPRGERAKRD